MSLTKFCIFNFAPFKNKDIAFIIEFDDIKIIKAFIIDLNMLSYPFLSLNLKILQSSIDITFETFPLTSAKPAVTLTTDESTCKTKSNF